MRIVDQSIDPLLQLLKGYFQKLSVKTGTIEIGLGQGGIAMFCETRSDRSCPFVAPFCAAQNQHCGPFAAAMFGVECGEL